MWLVVPRADRRSLRREALLEVLVEDLEEPPGMSSPPAMLITIHHRPYEHHIPPYTHHYHSYNYSLPTCPPRITIATTSSSSPLPTTTMTTITTNPPLTTNIYHTLSIPLHPYNHISSTTAITTHPNHISAFYRAHSRLKLRTTHCRGPQRGEGLNRCIVGPHEENQPNAC